MSFGRVALTGIANGGYSIPANTTQTFTFWWPGSTSNDYFDVGIWPTTPGDSLRIVGKTVTADANGNFVLLMDIENTTERNVAFIANHIVVGVTSPTS